MNAVSLFLVNIFGKHETFCHLQFCGCLPPGSPAWAGLPSRARWHWLEFGSREVCYVFPPVFCVEDNDFFGVFDASWGTAGGLSLVGWIFMTRVVDSQKLMNNLRFPVWLPVVCPLKFILCKLITSLQTFLLSRCFHVMPSSYEITFWMSHLFFDLELSWKMQV